MAGNYRSSGSGITRAVSGAVRASRSTHVRKGLMKKGVEAAKQISSHKSANRVNEIKERGNQERTTAKYKVKLKEKVRKANVATQVKIKKTVEKKTNDLDVGKKKAPKAKKPKLSKEKKW